MQGGGYPFRTQDEGGMLASLITANNALRELVRAVRAYTDSTGAAVTLDSIFQVSTLRFARNLFGSGALPPFSRVRRGCPRAGASACARGVK